MFRNFSASQSLVFFSVSLSLQFVAQPNCQQLLATLWYDGFPGWRRRHWAVKLVTCFIIGLLFPVFSLVQREEGGRKGGSKGGRRSKDNAEEANLCIMKLTQRAEAEQLEASQRKTANISFIK